MLRLQIRFMYIYECVDSTWHPCVESCGTVCFISLQLALPIGHTPTCTCTLYTCIRTHPGQPVVNPKLLTLNVVLWEPLN